MNTFLILQEFAQSVSLADSYPLVSNKNLLQVVNAWRSVRVNWFPPEEVDRTEMDDHDVWDYLWTFCEWDFEDLSLISGFTVPQSLVLLERAKRLRLVFPNGGISPAATRILDLKVTEHIAPLVRTRRRIEKDRQEKENPPKAKKKRDRA